MCPWVTWSSCRPPAARCPRSSRIAASPAADGTAGCASFCAERRIVYQGFSLLTANPEILGHPLVARIAAREHATPAQVVFRFAQAVGMLPLTGTSDSEHMVQDLASHALTLSPDEVRTIESLSG